MKTINITSFSYDNGRPKVNASGVVYSVKKMNNVDKTIRDKYTGTSAQLQKELMNDDFNKNMYDKLVADVIKRVLLFQSNNETELNIFIGCNAGKHRSVATVCVLSSEITCKFNDININTSHMMLDADKLKMRKKDKLITRSKNRDEKMDVSC